MWWKRNVNSEKVFKDAEESQGNQDAYICERQRELSHSLMNFKATYPRDMYSSNCLTKLCLENRSRELVPLDDLLVADV